MSEFPRLMKLVFLGAFVESIGGVQVLSNRKSGIHAEQLTPKGFGDGFIEEFLLKHGYVSDIARAYNGDEVVELSQLPGKSSRVFRFTATDKLFEEIPSVESLDTMLNEEINNEDGAELFKLCLLIGAWNLVAFSSELLSEMGVHVTRSWLPHRDRAMELLSDYSPAEARYFLWMAQRKVAIDLLANRLPREDAEESMMEIAINLGNKYAASKRKATPWKWYKKQRDCRIEAFLKRLIRPGADLDSQTPEAIAFGN